MYFVAIFQSAQNRNRILNRWLAHQHRLESAFERRILFDIFFVFIQRSGADRPQFAARQRWLQHVRRVHGAFGCACSHQRVQLVDEQNDLTFGLADFL